MFTAMATHASGAVHHDTYCGASTDNLPPAQDTFGPGAMGQQFGRDVWDVVVCSVMGYEF